MVCLEHYIRKSLHRLPYSAIVVRVRAVWRNSYIHSRTALHMHINTNRQTRKWFD